MTPEVRWKLIYTYHHREKAVARQRAAALNEQACAAGVNGKPLAEWRVRVLLDGVLLESRPVPYDLPFKKFSIGWTFWMGARAVCLHCGTVQENRYVGGRGLAGILESGVRWSKKHKPWCPGPLEAHRTAPGLQLDADSAARFEHLLKGRGLA